MVRKLFATAALTLMSTGALAQMNLSDLKWRPAPPSLPKGAKVAVLSGNPEQKGPFVMRVDFPAGFTVAPHHHPTDEYVTVISGNMSIGMGNHVDRASMKALSEGGFVRAKAGMNHYVTTKSGGVVQINGTGPFTIIYANPADDPRKHK
jgi:quercetin dioxygenase-like cupin family protein